MTRSLRLASTGDSTSVVTRSSSRSNGPPSATSRRPRSVKPHAAALAFEHRGVKGPFKLLDLLRDGRGGEAERVGGGDHRAVPLDGHQRAQCLQIDHEAMLQETMKDSKLVLHGHSVGRWACETPRYAPCPARRPALGTELPVHRPGAARHPAAGVRGAALCRGRLPVGVLCAEAQCRAGRSSPASG